MPANNAYRVTFMLVAALAPHEAEEWATELARDAVAHLYGQNGERLAFVSVEPTTPTAA